MLVGRDQSIGEKSSLRAPQTGQDQFAGMSSNFEPGIDSAVGVALRRVVDIPAELADPEIAIIPHGA